MITVSKSSFIISLFRSDWMLLLAVVARSIPLTAEFSFLILAIYAFQGNRQVIKALIFTWLLIALNKALVPGLASGMLGRYLVIFASFASIMLRIDFNLKKIDSLLFLTVFLGVFFGIHAIFISPIPDVSILKAINWTLTIFTLYMAWSNLNLAQHEYMQRWILGFLLTVAILSIPTYFFPEVAFRRSGTGFQGIINHPQIFGPVMAIVGALILGKLLIEKRPSWGHLFLFFSIFILIILTESRTALVALVIGTILAIFYISLISKYGVRAYIPAVKSKRAFLIGILIIIFLVLDSLLFNFVDYFITKSFQADVDGLFDAFSTSRAVLYEPMIANIKENPLSGIGFGIASDYSSMEIARDPILGLPLGAPVEKGVTPIMILEEVGIIGFIIFFIWLLFILSRSLKKGIGPFLVLLTLLLANLSEATLFSPGGAGLFQLIILSSCVTRVRFSQYPSKKAIKENV